MSCLFLLELICLILTSLPLSDEKLPKTFRDGRGNICYRKCLGSHAASPWGFCREPRQRARPRNRAGEEQEGSGRRSHGRTWTCVNEALKKEERSTRDELAGVTMQGPLGSWPVFSWSRGALGHALHSVPAGRTHRAWCLLFLERSPGQGPKSYSRARQSSHGSILNGRHNLLILEEQRPLSQTRVQHFSKWSMIFITMMFPIGCGSRGSMIIGWTTVIPFIQAWRWEFPGLLTKILFCIVFSVGFCLWLIGMLVNIHSDHILRNLRKPGETGYKIPRGMYWKREA